MLDKKWLESIRCESKYGFKVVGLVAIGSEKVVLNIVTTDGKEQVLYTSRCELGYHLKEIPLFLSDLPQYDVNILNEKIIGLAGSDVLHKWTYFLNCLHVRFLKIIKNNGVQALVFSSMTPESEEYIPFFLKSPGMKERLTELANWPEPDPDEPLSMFITIPGELGGEPFQDTVISAHEWAIGALREIEKLPELQDLKPSSMYENPLILWGAAIMSNLFTDDELDIAVEFVEAKFGRLPERDDIVTILSQFSAIASMVAQCGIPYENSDLKRWTRFATKLGCIVRIHDREGNTVA